MDYTRRLTQLPPHMVESYKQSGGRTGWGWPVRYWFVDVDGATVTTQHGHITTEDVRRAENGVTQMKGRVHRKVWPTPEKAMHEVEKKVAQLLPKDYRDTSIAGIFTLGDPPPDPAGNSIINEPYELASNPDHDWIETYDWFAVPNRTVEYQWEPLWDKVVTDHETHVCPDNILAGELTTEQAAVVRPIIYTYDVNRLTATAQNISGAVRPIVDELVTSNALPDLPEDTPWWKEATATFRGRRSLPDGVGVHSLPPLVVGDVKLDSRQRLKFLRAVLAEGSTSALYKAVVDRLTPRCQYMVGLAALRLWVSTGSTKPYRGLLTLAADFVPDLAAALLSEMSLKWQTENAFRSVTAASALAEINTQASTEAVVRILVEHPNRLARDGAQVQLQALAEKRGVPLDDILDTLVTTCGLPENGIKTYSFGNRTFRAAVDSHGNFSARRLDVHGNPIGKILTGLPKPGVKDDATRAEKARVDFRQTRKNIRKVTKAQLLRFERLMITGRIWQGAHFTEHIANHPIVGGALTGLLWEVRDGDGGRTFARLDDMCLVDADEAPAALDGKNVTIPHPVDIQDVEAQRWRAIFAEYDLAAPFAQLDRPTFALPDDQGDDIELHDLPEQAPATYRVVSMWDKHGWRRCALGDGGWEYERRLHLAAFGLQVFMEITGYQIEDAYSDDPMPITKVTTRRWDGKVATQAENDNDAKDTPPMRSPGLRCQRASSARCACSLTN